jgi:hypothetical protein
MVGSRAFGEREIMHVVGYLDPGSTSMIASGIAAAFAGIVLFFKMGARRVIGLFSPKRRRAAAESDLADEES